MSDLEAKHCQYYKCEKPLMGGKKLCEHHHQLYLNNWRTPESKEGDTMGADTMSNTENVTITKKDIVARVCAHCATKTLHVGKVGNTCLQCIADNELVGCCTIKQFNRWKDATGKILTVARGVKP